MAIKLHYIAAVIGATAAIAIFTAPNALAAWAAACTLAGSMLLWRLSVEARSRRPAASRAGRGLQQGFERTAGEWCASKPVALRSDGARRLEPMRPIPPKRRPQAAHHSRINGAISIISRLEGQQFEKLVAGTVTDLHAAITGDTIPTPELATRAAMVITADPKLRSAVLRLGDGNEYAAARTWTYIAAQLRGSARADALTVAATHYYLANEPTCVVVALDEADDAARGTNQRTTPALACMLAASLVLQLPPDQVRATIPSRAEVPIPGTTF